MSYIKYNYDLIIAGSIIKNKNLTKTYIRSRPNINKNLIFKPTEINEFAKIVNDQLTYIGCVIIKKSVLKSDKKIFWHRICSCWSDFDRLLSNDILVIKKPLTIIRFGDGLWTNRAFQIWMLDWPKLIWFLIPYLLKQKTYNTKNPWKNPKSLLLMRALGNYNYEIYKTYIASQN